MKQLSKYNQINHIQQRIPSTLDRPSGPLLEERNITNRVVVAKNKQGGQRQKRSSILDEGEGETPDDSRLVINDEFYDNNTTVFERLGPKRIQLTSPASNNQHFRPPFSEQQAWRGDLTPS